MKANCETSDLVIGLKYVKINVSTGSPTFSQHELFGARPCVPVRLVYL